MSKDNVEIQVHKKNWSWIFYVAFLLMAVFIFWQVHAEMGTDDTSLKHLDMLSISDGWEKVSSDGSVTKVDVSERLDVEESQNSVTVTRKIDWDKAYTNLMIYSSHTMIDVYIDDAKVYSYGQDNKRSRFFKVPGSVWHDIRLKESDYGKTLKIVSEHVLDKHKGKVGWVYASNNVSMGDAIIRMNLVGVSTALVMLAFALILVFIWIGMRNILEDDRLLHLGIMAVGMVLWSFNDMQIAQLFIDNATIYSYITFELLPLMPVPLINYFRSGPDSKIKSACRYLKWVPVINFSLINVLHFTAIMDLNDSLFLTHIAVLILICAFIFLSIAGKKRGIEEFVGKMENIGFIIFMVFTFLDVYRYYIIPFSADALLFARVGCLIYLMSLGVGSVKSSFDMVLLGQKAAIYEHMAFHDKLTGQLNRTAYQEKLAKLDKDEARRKQCIIMGIDINDLKLVNDTKGHDAGDQYILDNVECINHIFDDCKESGACYRIGGDEFAIIYEYASDEEKKRFYKCCEEVAKALQEQSKANFAYGSAEYDELLDKTILDTVKRADALMYDNKRSMKQENEK